MYQIWNTAVCYEKTDLVSSIGFLVVKRSMWFVPVPVFILLSKVAKQIDDSGTVPEILSEFEWRILEAFLRRF